MHQSYSSEAFEQQYTYTGNDLGSVWTPEGTAFRLWAPTASEAYICLYRSGDPTAQDLLARIPMEPDVNGTWMAQRSGDLQGYYYTCQVCVDGQIREACDPYARTTGVNGHRAMILNSTSTNPPGWEQDANPNKGLSVTDAVIYELHVRDLSMDRSSRIRHRGKYLGFTQTGTKTRGGSPTGIDHIRSLGVTHVHLLPVYDFGFTDEGRKSPQYNWGYDPVHFNVPEGSYSTDPHNGAVRVAEMKAMVKALHDAGLSVVMDVVYNHVYDAGNFCFNALVPGYFSRINADGSYSNGSCCGNDTASERSMVRKYIVDSVNYWADEYHIDGFRFDLVGLIDVQTLQEVMQTVGRKHPDTIFYGEGWSMNTSLTKKDISLAVQSSAHELPGFAFFNDSFRDMLRGSVFHRDSPGYICGAAVDSELLDRCFRGDPGWAMGPAQSVNYGSCHDNHTLFDRITLAAPEAPFEIRAKMNNLAAAFTMLSQGVPFLQAGEEMLRTKPGKKGGFDENSYRSSDKVNALKWATLDQPEYRANVDYYRGLIRFRKAHPGLRAMTREQVERSVTRIPCGNRHVAAFYVLDGAEELLLIFNADTQDVRFHPQEGRWNVHIRGNQAGTEILDTVQDTVIVPPISAMVLSRKKPVDVVAGLIWEKDKFLVCQRPAHKTRGLLWEFAGGKVEPGETMPEALQRECMEELGVKIEVRDRFMQVLHSYPDMTVRLTLFHCTIPEGFPQPLEHNELRWVHPGQTGGLEFCPADIDILKEIRRIYGHKKPL